MMEENKPKWMAILEQIEKSKKHRGDCNERSDENKAANANFK
jgi:hypothetical protein